LKRDLHFQDNKIVRAHPKFARQQTEESFFARANILVRLWFERDDVSVLA